MTAYLHIGTTNTGNQEKQGFLMQNEEKLLQKLIFTQKVLEWQIGIGLWWIWF